MERLIKHHEQGANGSEICVSEVATFDKPAYQQPKNNNNGNGETGGNGDE